MAVVLSEKSIGVAVGVTFRSVSSLINHTISREAKLKARYSASEDEQDTVSYFLDLQEMIEEPRNMQKPVVDLLLS